MRPLSKSIKRVKYLFPIFGQNLKCEVSEQEKEWSKRKEESEREKGRSEECAAGRKIGYFPSKSALVEEYCCFKFDYEINAIVEM
jgi:hypothetical protein